MSYTMYDNYGINYTEWFEEFKEYCMDNDIDHTQYNEDSERFLNWLYDSLSMDWDDLIANIKYDKHNNVDCVVTGSVGRWNGTFDIQAKHFPTLEKAIITCVDNMDYIIITEDEGTINVTAIHHDGRNHFKIHKLNAKGYDAHCEDKDLNNEKYFDKFKIEW